MKRKIMLLCLVAAMLPMPSCGLFNSDVRPKEVRELDEAQAERDEHTRQAMEAFYALSSQMVEMLIGPFTGVKDKIPDVALRQKVKALMDYLEARARFIETSSGVLSRAWGAPKKPIELPKDASAEVLEEETKKLKKRVDKSDIKVKKATKDLADKALADSLLERVGSGDRAKFGFIFVFLVLSIGGSWAVRLSAGASGPILGRVVLYGGLGLTAAYAMVVVYQYIWIIGIVGIAIGAGVFIYMTAKNAKLNKKLVNGFQNVKDSLEEEEPAAKEKLDTYMEREFRYSPEEKAIESIREERRRKELKDKLTVSAED